MWIDLGRFLGEQHPQATLAIDAAGKVPYFSRLQTIDMLGLNDRHIASLRGVAFLRVGHNKFRTPDMGAEIYATPGASNTRVSVVRGYGTARALRVAHR